MIEAITVNNFEEVVGAMSVVTRHIEGLIGIRQISPERIPYSLATGTDRDQNSRVYESEGDCHGMHASRPELVTYMRVVDTRLNPPMSIPLNRAPNPNLDIFHCPSRFSGGVALLVYDPNKVYRASENEFWFTGNPLDALVTAVVVRPKTESKV